MSRSSESLGESPRAPSHGETSEPASPAAHREARTALLLPDGVGVRNFVLGPFLRRIRMTNRVLALHCIPEPVLQSYDGAIRRDVEWRPLTESKDSVATLMLRKVLGFAHMYQADTFAMRYKLSRVPKGSRRDRTVTRTARFAGHVVAAAGAIRVLDRLHWSAIMRRPAVREYRRAFRLWKPSVLLSSNQRAISVIAPVLAARSLGIPTAAFIFSWDNLTTKGRIAAPFDHFLVWSEHMRAELLRFYPEVDPERVHVVGTPQFESYSDESLILPREAFLRRLGADPGRPLICYSGGDSATCPEDPEHVSLLMEAIRSGRIAGSPQVVLRPMPVDREERYDEVRRRFPELIYARPSWVRSDEQDWTRVIPTAEDLALLANLIRHADLNVNVASTMTLDFAIHDKPVVNIAFDVANPPPFGVPLQDYYYRFDHYRPVVELGASRIARSSSELADHINAYLSDPNQDRENRRRLVDLEIGAPIGRSVSRIVEVLNWISSGGAGKPHFEG